MLHAFDKVALNAGPTGWQAQLVSRALPKLAPFFFFFLNLKIESKQKILELSLELTTRKRKLC